MEYPNLNDMDNPIVTMKLEAGWTAEKATWQKPVGFEFNDYKNKFIPETYGYNLSDEKGEERGEYGLIGRYHNSDASSFPNHIQSTSVVYEGPTVLGKGVIYLLKLDLPKELRTKDKDYYLMYYALVPIENEHLAYNLTLKVPEGQSQEATLDAMKKLLGADR